MTIDTQVYKGKLETELKRLREELKTVGFENPDLPGDWIPQTKGEDSSRSDDNDVADKMDNYQENTDIVDKLEVQYNDVRHALEHIEKGTYGKCEICNNEIEEDRLEANPAARTCKTHLNEHLGSEL